MKQLHMLAILAAASVGGGSAFAGTCQGTTGSWTTLQTTCGARTFDAQGLNASGGFPKGLRVQRTFDLIDAGAQGVNSGGSLLAGCIVKDATLDGNSSFVFSDTCLNAVKYTYRGNF